MQMLPGGSDKGVVDGKTINVTNSSSPEEKDSKEPTGTKKATSNRWWQFW